MPGAGVCQLSATHTSKPADAAWASLLAMQGGSHLSPDDVVSLLFFCVVEESRASRWEQPTGCLYALDCWTGLYLSRWLDKSIDPGLAASRSGEEEGACRL